MDAEGFKVKMSELENPKDLTLTELVESIAANERLLTTGEVLGKMTRTKPTPEESCILDSSKGRLKLLYDELKQRAEKYRDY